MDFQQNQVQLTITITNYLIIHCHPSRIIFLADLLVIRHGLLVGRQSKENRN